MNFKFQTLKPSGLQSFDHVLGRSESEDATDR